MTDGDFLLRLIKAGMLAGVIDVRDTDEAVTWLCGFRAGLSLTGALPEYAMALLHVLEQRSGVADEEVDNWHTFTHNFPIEMVS